MCCVYLIDLIYQVNFLAQNIFFTQKKKIKYWKVGSYVNDNMCNAHVHPKKIMTSIY